jgi:MFS family permease
MLGLGNVAPFLPIMARDMGASGLVLGLIFSSFSAARAMVATWVGTLSDRWGRKPFLLAGMGGTAAVGLLFLWAHSPWAIVANRALQGVFAAMILPVAMALVADLSPSGGEGRSFGSFNTFFLLGFGVGPLLGGTLFDVFGLAANFLAMTGLCLASLVVVACRVREPPLAHRLREGGGWRNQVALLRDRPLLGLFLARVGGSMAMGCYIAFLPLLSTDRRLSNFQVGLLLAINVLVMTALQGQAGRLADRRSRLGLAVWGQAVSALSKLFVPLCPGFWSLLTLNVVEGVGAGLALPALTSLVVEYGRRLGSGMGAAMGLFAMAMSLGVFFGPLLGGGLIDLTGTDAPFYLAGLVALAGALAQAVGAGRRTLVVEGGRGRREPAS